MAEPRPLDERLEEWEAIWNLVSRILGFFFGLILLAVAGVLMVGDDQNIRLGIAAAGAAMMGPAVAIPLATIVKSARGGGSE